MWRSRGRIGHTRSWTVKKNSTDMISPFYLVGRIRHVTLYIDFVPLLSILSLLLWELWFSPESRFTNSIDADQKIRRCLAADNVVFSSGP